MRIKTSNYGKIMRIMNLYEKEILKVIEIFKLFLCHWLTGDVSCVLFIPILLMTFYLSPLMRWWEGRLGSIKLEKNNFPVMLAGRSEAHD